MSTGLATLSGLDRDLIAQHMRCEAVERSPLHCIVCGQPFWVGRHHTAGRLSLETCGVICTLTLRETDARSTLAYAAGGAA